MVVTYGDRSRTAFTARAVALGALAFFWLLLGIFYFMADGVEPILRGVKKEMLVLAWLGVFASALWGMVRNLKQAGKELAEKTMEIIKTPSAYAGPDEEPAAVPPAIPVKAPAKPVDMKAAEGKLAGLVGGENGK
ncbi:MAG: hypothetical protein ACO1QS_19100 [Verrucomicrobiota bacterium]